MIHIRGESIKAVGESVGVFTPSGQGKSVSPEVKVRYASLPAKFNKTAVTPRLRLAQHARTGTKGQKQCRISTSRRTRRTRVRRSSGVKLGKQYIYYSLDFRSGGVLSVGRGNRVTRFPLHGVEVVIPLGGSTVARVALDVTVQWNAKRQKIMVDGKVLKSTKITGTGYHRWLQFDQRELSKLVETQRKELFYRMDNDDKASVLRNWARQFVRIDAQLNLLKRRGVSFRKDTNIRKIYNLLKKHKGLLDAYGSLLQKQGRDIRRWKKQRQRFLPAFRKKLSALERQHKTLTSQYNKVRKQLSGILYKYWYRYRRVRKRPC